MSTLVDTLTIENLRLQEVEGENERLRKLLNFQQLNPTYDYRGGQIIALQCQPDGSRRNRNCIPLTGFCAQYQAKCLFKQSLRFGKIALALQQTGK